MRLSRGIPLFVFTAWLAAQPFDPSLFRELRWRSIGPLRGGRTRAVSGAPGQPATLYIGVCNGGVWKSTDYGRVWQPVFDSQPTGSIGAIAVAPSDPSIVYVASGEGLQRPDLSVGDGIYKSTDAGRTWVHLGLRDGQQIPRLAVDPRNPERVFAAVLGHPYGPNAERGLYRSTDGGQSFEKVLSVDENTGASWVEIDPRNPAIVYAALWEARQGPWENGAWSGTSGGIFKSTDGGSAWRKIERGIVSGDDGVVQANLALAPSDPRRLYATVATTRGVGIFRSDDAGENWRRVTTGARPAGRIGGGDLSVPTVDPLNPDILYIASTVAWKSLDGGATWTAFRGAPGGDDYQGIWISPQDPNLILMASDQGAVVTVNGGATWSSWYNQSSAQMYHVSTDNAFPYRVCGGQQESGSACVSSRGDDGAITFREWHPVGVEEYGFVAPDPLNPDLVYGGKVTRFDRRTGQVANVAPKPLRDGNFRALRTQPVVFSPADPRLLLFAANTIWVTRDGGRSWKEISPDLTRKTWEIPSSVGRYRTQPTAQASQRGVIYAVAPSPLDVNRIWAGTDDGLIHLTVNGGLTWTDVTPPQLTPFAKVSILEASRFDPRTAYAAINTLRLDDMRPHILRTRDAGKTWAEVVSGIPDGAPVNVVREDPKRKGLLYAGTEREVYVSFDDGGHWQSLRVNMPATSIRDLAVKDDDLIAGTHGRGFWILDDVTPLRQLTPAAAQSPAHLFAPQTATRVRWNMNTDTPLPPEEPRSANPPDGAVIHYWLGPAASGEVVLEILDSAGRPVRRYSSTDPIERPDPMLAIPAYWVRPPRPLPASPGLHRFLWDMRYTPLAAGRGNYPIAAIPGDTAPAATSPWVMPGVYTVKLTANGKTLTQPLTVRLDPRVKTPAAGLLAQFTHSKQAYDDVLAARKVLDEIRAVREGLLATQSPQAAELARKADSLAGAPALGFRRGAPAGPPTIQSLSSAVSGLLQLLQEADVAPTSQALAALASRRQALAGLLTQWTALKKELAAVTASR